MGNSSPRQGKRDGKGKQEAGSQSTKVQHGGGCASGKLNFLWWLLPVMFRVCLVVWRDCRAQHELHSVLESGPKWFALSGGGNWEGRKPEVLIRAVSQFSTWHADSTVSLQSKKMQWVIKGGTSMWACPTQSFSSFPLIKYHWEQQVRIWGRPGPLSWRQKAEEKSHGWSEPGMTGPLVQ